FVALHSSPPHGWWRPLGRSLLLNVGLNEREVRPRFRHLKQQIAFLFVCSFRCSSSTIERLSPVMDRLSHGSSFASNVPTHPSGNKFFQGILVPGPETKFHLGVLSGYETHLRKYC